MVDCLMSGDAELTEVEIQNLGRIGIRVLAGEGYPKRMNILRNGMAITDTLEGVVRGMRSGKWGFRNI